MNLNLQRSKGESVARDANYMYFMADSLIVKIFAAILISTIAMATLEPCLPIWLMATLKPEVYHCLFIIIGMKTVELLNFYLYRNGKLEPSSYQIQ